MASSISSSSWWKTAIACALTLAIPSAARTSLAATLSGPITGGEHGRPFTSSVVDLAAHGYVEEEYFLAGTATTYAPAPGTTLGSDGRWDIVPAGTAPFPTRILVRRPEDGRRFNGTFRPNFLSHNFTFSAHTVRGDIPVDDARLQARKVIIHREADFFHRFRTNALDGL